MRQNAPPGSPAAISDHSNAATPAANTPMTRRGHFIGGFAAGLWHRPKILAVDFPTYSGLASGAGFSGAGAGDGDGADVAPLPEEMAGPSRSKKRKKSPVGAPT